MCFFFFFFFLFKGEVDPKERIARQRKLLQKKLGLNMGEAIGMSTEELFNDEDLDYTPTSAALVNKQPVGKIFGCLKIIIQGVCFILLCNYGF